MPKHGIFSVVAIDSERVVCRNEAFLAVCAHPHTAAVRHQNQITATQEKRLGVKMEPITSAVKVRCVTLSPTYEIIHWCLIFILE